MLKVMNPSEFGSDDLHQQRCEFLLEDFYKMLNEFEPFIRFAGINKSQLHKNLEEYLLSSSSSLEGISRFSYHMGYPSHYHGIRGILIKFLNSNYSYKTIIKSTEYNLYLAGGDYGQQET